MMKETIFMMQLTTTYVCDKHDFFTLLRTSRKIRFREKISTKFDPLDDDVKLVLYASKAT